MLAYGRAACRAGRPQRLGNDGPRHTQAPHLSVSLPQLHSEPAGGVHAAAGLPEAPAGQQGALGGPAAAAAGAAAAGERGAQAAAAGRAPEAHRGAEGAAAAAGGGEGLPAPQGSPHLSATSLPGCPALCRGPPLVGLGVPWKHTP